MTKPEEKSLSKPDSFVPKRIAIIGVGLLGGSVSLAMRRRIPDVHVVGMVRDTAKADRFVASGLLDSATDSIEQACRDCDCIVVATPVDCLADIVIQAAKLSPDDCLITDVGSTKAAIVHSVAANPIAAEKFVAAHPIAGSEKSGADFALESLFDGKPIVLTPDTHTNANLLQRATEFWTLVGGVPIVMPADQHDVHLASVSHVPHLVSALVAKMVEGPARDLVGSGWRDITRVAAGDPEMWTAICAANRDAIVGELDRFSDHLSKLRAILAGDDTALNSWLAKAKEAKELTR